MRNLTGHKVNDTNNNIEITVTDEPGQGGANHQYQITKQDDGKLLGMVTFQNGPIKEFGVNGITQEALLEICADRLRSFQAGPFSSRENAIALTHIETAQLWLHKRTLDRLARGVEGTNQK
jgi:hypothetical protein